VKLCHAYTASGLARGEVVALLRLLERAVASVCAAAAAVLVAGAAAEAERAEPLIRIVISLAWAAGKPT
jgi:hypothetical protein